MNAYPSQELKQPKREYEAPRSEHPILFFKGKNMRTTTLLAFLEKVHITKRTLVNEQLPFRQPHHPTEHRKVTVYRRGADTR